MPAENKDLNNAQVVIEPDLNADVVNQTDLNNTDVVGQENQDKKLADGTDADKTVPYAKLKEATDARKAAEDREKLLQQQVALVTANQQVNQQQIAQQPKSTYEQAMVDLGYTSDDLYGDAIVKVQNRKAELDAALQQQQGAINANVQFVASHSDFNQVVGSVDPTTKAMIWSPEALSLIQKKPYLAGAFQSAQGVYQAVMDERKLIDFEKKATVNQELANRQGLDNASLPLGGSAVGSGGAADPQNQQLLSKEQVKAIEQDIADGKYE